MDAEPYGKKIEEWERLKGATILECEEKDDGYRIVLGLKDGAKLEGSLTRDEYDRMVFAGVPLIDDATIAEPAGEGAHA